MYHYQQILGQNPLPHSPQNDNSNSHNDQKNSVSSDNLAELGIIHSAEDQKKRDEGTVQY